MTKRGKLVERMRDNPRGIRFAEVHTLLEQEGFVLFNQRGSHCTYHRHDGRVLTIVRPHGRHKTCHPVDIKKILKALNL
jgi:predicted RNA binding protein YcfA (HicA-like mRNA interferase family)